MFSYSLKKEILAHLLKKFKFFLYFPEAEILEHFTKRFLCYLKIKILKKKLLFKEKLYPCYLWNTIPCRWPPDFVFYLPMLPLGRHVTPLVTRWFAASTTNLRERSLFFQDFPGTSNSTSNSARLHGAVEV